MAPKKIIISLILLSLNMPTVFPSDQQQVIEGEKETIVMTENTIKITGHYTQEELDYSEKLRKARMRKNAELAKEKEQELMRIKEAEEKAELERTKIDEQWRHELRVATAEAPKITVVENVTKVIREEPQPKHEDWYVKWEQDQKRKQEHDEILREIQRLKWERN